MEIGSEFWLDKNGLHAPANHLPDWLGKYGDVRLTSSGSGAIRLALNQINPKVKKALLPSYLCESMIWPFEEAGYEIFYYDLDEYFQPQDRQIEQTDIGVFLHMGYFGFPTNKKLMHTISVLKSKSVIVIEDVTHTLFYDFPNRLRSDYLIGSLRKWMGIPSGGFLAADKLGENDLSEPPKDFIDLRTTSLSQKYDYMQTKKQALKTNFLEGFQKAEKTLDEDRQIYRIDELSKSILQQTDSKRIKQLRQSNYTFLATHLKSIKEIDVIFEELDDAVCPIFLPIYVKNGRDELRAALIKKEIYCAVHWPVPQQLKDRLNSKIEHMYDSILSIPCDQRYNQENMNKIVNSIKEIMLKK